MDADEFTQQFPDCNRREASTEVMRRYASIRHFLRTLRWVDFTNEESRWELFVNDLSLSPGGMNSYAAHVVTN